MRIWTTYPIVAEYSSPHPDLLHCGGREEEMIRPDMPIVEYRKKRERLKQQDVG
jgi:hypothetical protein